MRRPWEPEGPYISRGAAAYPGMMNHVLAERLVRAAVQTRVQCIQAQAMVRSGRWANTLVAAKRLRADAIAKHGTACDKRGGTSGRIDTIK